jgi:MoxR-like ATPase
VVEAEELEALQQQARRVACEPPLLDYLLDLLAASRQGGLATGTPLSPRAGCALVAAAKAWALLEGRSYVVPADVQAVFPAVAEHRLDGGRPAQEPGGYSRQLLAAVEAIR